jgi:hypothetical protein
VIAPGIAFYATTTVVSPEELRAGVAAIDRQLTEDFCPAWGKLPIRASFFEDPRKIPPGTPTILIADRCDVARALAYHTEQASGAITGLVGVLTCEEDGESWTSAASHEALEAARNPYVNGWTTVPGHGGHRKVADEVCDPVQDGEYEIDGVKVSNFVYPAWFDGLAPVGSQFDHLEQLAGPFTKTEGGYYEYDVGGVVHQAGKRARHRARVKHGRRPAAARAEAP